MDPLLVAILSAAAALAALIVGMITSLRRDLGQRLDRIEKRIDGVEKRIDGVDERLNGFDERLRAVEQGLAEVKGKLTFVENYILRRNEPAGGAAPAE